MGRVDSECYVVVLAIHQAPKVLYMVIDKVVELGLESVQFKFSNFDGGILYLWKNGEILPYRQFLFSIFDSLTGIEFHNGKVAIFNTCAAWDRHLAFRNA